MRDGSAFIFPLPPFDAGGYLNVATESNRKGGWQQFRGGQIYSLKCWLEWR
jgi:hypothetical protein